MGRLGAERSLFAGSALLIAGMALMGGGSGRAVACPAGDAAGW